MNTTAGVSLLSFLAEVPDPRSRHGRRHPPAAMLAHACCAVLCGCRGIAPIAQWGRDQPIELMHRLGYRRRPASFGAFQALFARLDAGAFEAAVAGWVADLIGPRAGAVLRAVAIDGKSARGSRTADAPAVHLLAALDQGERPAKSVLRWRPAWSAHRCGCGGCSLHVARGTGSRHGGSDTPMPARRRFPGSHFPA